jgi:hypothetical protein
MKARFLAAIAVIATALVVIGSAAAFDCIRVSSSWQGLQQSTQSGNWLAFNMSSRAAVSQTFQTIFGAPVPDEVATCVADAYATYNVSPYFALGVGVAGGRTGNGIGVLAWNNKNTVLFGNLRGIDHLDDSPIGQALFGSLESCGISVE